MSARTGAAVPQALVLSLPARLADYDAMALPAAGFRPEQVLFGGDAQAAVVVRLLEAARVPAVFVPAPEIFHDATTFSAIERLLPESWRAGDAPLRHLRFGPLKDCRLLKFAENAHLLAEAPRRREVRISGNPFSGRQAVPAALRRILRYGTDGDLVCLDGARPEHVDLPRHLAAADLAAWAGPACADLPRAASGETARGGLERVSFAACRRAAATPPEPDAAPAPIRPSLALPFNCADPGSMIPEIVFTFARFPGPAESGIALTLLPYNERDGEPRLERLVNRAAMMLERREPRIAEEQLLVARVRRPLPAALLRQLFPSAVLDGGDPESVWVQARLNALGIPAVVNAPAAGPDDAVPVPPGRRFERFEDAQSPRLIEIEKPSRTRCMELLSEAHAAAGRRVPAPLAAQAVDLRPILGEPA